MVLVLWWADFELRDAFSIQQHVDLVSSSQPFNVFIAIARKTDCDFVFTILRERVRDQHAASSPNRQTGQVPFLCQVRGNTKRFPIRPTSDSPHRRTSDLLSCEHIPIQQGRREFSDRDIVKPVAERIRRQQRLGIDIQSQ